ncbi:MAG: helix-turn-helix domain-containing protein [Deltaproteobacteria bacterium]|nr:helix-turn-helix domain-containing protein [Deltaproteobacteria bacterium]
MEKITEEDIRETLAANVRYIRKARGWSQSDLCALAFWGEKNQTMVSQIENGTLGAGPQTLAKLANALGVPASYLFREDLEQALPKTVKIPSVKASDLLKEEAERATLPPIKLKKQKVFLASNVAKALKSSPTPGKFRLPDWFTGRNTKNLYCVVIEKDDKVGRMNTGDMFCIDKGNKPDPFGPDEKGHYLVELETGLAVRYGEKVGATLNLKTESELGPHVIDLRLHGKSVIGTVIWMFRSI